MTPTRCPTPTRCLTPSLYYLHCLLQVGYGDITPTNDLERAYTLLALMLGALLFGYLVSGVGSLIDSLDTRSIMVNAKLDQVQEVILHSSVPPELAQRIRSYTQFYYSRQSVYDMDEVFSHLTPALVREVKEEQLSRSVDRMPLLRVHSIAFKLELFAELKPFFKEANEDIITKGSRADEVFFLSTGEVHARSASAGTVTRLNEEGRWFDENALLRRSCPFTYVAFTRCEMYTMHISTLLWMVLAHLSEHGKHKLLSDVIKECMRKSRMRFLVLRMHLVELEHQAALSSSPSAGKRTRAALAIQAAHIWRATLPAAYQHFRALDVWRNAGSDGLSVGGDGHRANHHTASTSQQANVDVVNESVRVIGRQQAEMAREVSELKEQTRALHSKLDRNETQLETAIASLQSLAELFSQVGVRDDSRTRRHVAARPTSPPERPTSPTPPPISGSQTLRAPKRPPSLALV